MRFNRGLVVPVVLVVVVIAAALGAGRSKQTGGGARAGVGGAPAGMGDARPSVGGARARVSGAPASVGFAPASVGFGSMVQLIPSPAGLDYSNGWVASSKTAVIGVYAGSPAKDRADGLLVVARTSDGKRALHRFALHGSGAVTLLKPPRPANESAAWRETIRFVTANGATGVLDLATNRLSVSR